MITRKICCGLGAVFALLLSPAQLPAEGHVPNGLDPEGIVAANEARENLGRIDPWRVWRDATAATAGTGLRNRGAGAIDLGDVRGPVRRAFLYWTLISDGPPPEGGDTIRVQRLLPERSRARLLTGTAIGTGVSPCWGGDRITVFRAAVPAAIVNGQGTYIVSPPEGVPGRTDGSDPFAGSPLPAYNGASIVAIGDGFETVAVYDEGFAGKSMLGALKVLDYTLLLPPAIANGVGFARLHQINADGQEGPGRGRVSRSAGEIVRVNGTPISGPGSEIIDGDWNGSAGGAIAQLWDDRLREISALMEPGNRRLRMQIERDTDCLTTVANIVVR